MISILLALLVVPMGLSAEEVLSQDPRWDFGNVKQDDFYHYLICHDGAPDMCYEAEIRFYEDSGLFVHVMITEKLLQYPWTSEGYINIGDMVSGIHDDDIFYISYANINNPPREYNFAISEGFSLEPLAVRDRYTYTFAESITKTIFLIGGEVRVGDGPILQHDPVLEAGRVWTITEEPYVMVKEKKSEYSYGDLNLEDMLYVIEYLNREPLMQVTVAEGIPFPLEGHVMGDADIMRNDPNVSDRFWFKLIDTNHPAFAVEIVEIPEDIPEEIPEELLIPFTNVTIIPDIPEIILPPKLPDEPAKDNSRYTSELDEMIGTMTKDEFQELLAKFISTMGRGETKTEPAEQGTLEISADKNSYSRGDTIKFSGLTSFDTPTSRIMITDSEGVGIVSIPIIFDNDKRFSVETETNTWDAVGTLRATITHHGHTAGTTFDYNIDTFQFTDDSVHYEIEGRESDIEIFSDRISIYMDPGEDTILAMAIPYDIIPKAYTVEIYVDHQTVTFDEALAEERRLSVQIPSTATFVQMFFSDEAPETECLGTARCIESVITEVIDGDTIKIQGGQKIRFALTSAPELSDVGGLEASQYIATICPPGSFVTIDEDDKQTGGSYGRIIGTIHCDGENLNERLVNSGYGYISKIFCGKSEFASEPWAVRHGC